MANRELNHNVRTRPRAVQPVSALLVTGEDPAKLEQLVHAARTAAAQKRALHATIHNSTAPAKAIAEDAGIDYRFLCEAARDGSKDQLPFARLPLVLEACDDLTYLRFLADLQHADVLHRPIVAAAQASDARQAGAALREFAAFVEVCADALADDVIEPDELARMQREGLAVIDTIRQVLANYRARVRRPLLEQL